VVTAFSSNPVLIPVANLILAGSASNRTLVILPATNQFGTALISLTVADTNGAVRSTSFFVTVLPVPDPILITAPPQNQTVTAGASPSFGVTAISTLQPLFYQWQHNGAPLVGATNDTITLTNVQAADAGTYAVQISNGDGTATSVPARLTVVIEPMIMLITRTGTTVRVSFTTVVGGRYIVEYKDNLADASWTPLPTVAGTGALVTVIDPSATSPTRFYRVRAEVRVLIEPTIVLITQSGMTAHISFTTVEGLNYTVEFKDSLSDGSWTSLETVAGTGAVMVVADPSASAPTRFYRVRVD
jgi:hypothetical protein